MTHFVYVYLQSYAIWKEIEYSCKSIRKYYKYPFKVYIVGDNPKLRGSFHVPAERIKGHKFAKAFDATEKLIKICSRPDINEDFVYMYDDIIFLQPVKHSYLTQIVASHNVTSPLKESAKNIMASQRWKGQHYKTLIELQDEGLPTYSYETHLPRILNKKRVLEIINKYDLRTRPLLFATLYYNNYYPKPEALLTNLPNRKAVVVQSYNSDRIRKILRGKMFLNYEDRGLNRYLQAIIKDLFKP